MSERAGATLARSGSQSEESGQSGSAVQAVRSLPFGGFDGSWGELEAGHLHALTADKPPPAPRYRRQGLTIDSAPPSLSNVPRPAESSSSSRGTRSTAGGVALASGSRSVNLPSRSGAPLPPRPSRSLPSRHGNRDTALSITAQSAPARDRFSTNTLATEHAAAAPPPVAERNRVLPTPPPLTRPQDESAAAAGAPNPGDKAAAAPAKNTGDVSKAPAGREPANPVRVILRRSSRTRGLARPKPTSESVNLSDEEDSDLDAAPVEDPRYPGLPAMLPPGAAHQVSIGPSEMETLQAGRWLCTQIIDFYALYLQGTMQHDLSGVVFAHLFDKLHRLLRSASLSSKERLEQDLKKTLKNCGIQTVELLLQCRFLFLPVFFRSHFSLAVIVSPGGDDGHVLHLDSMPGLHGDHVQNVVRRCANLS
ncbi:hypothetical protein KFL_003430075 [Klebsormidium nitens]|uniref:Ubiquitin-like protease family profile domain-containing protein n=1 Tax=Klebsormidium nitens TaxID=105231 RepID=A0A0U9HKF7_KLENI|nr:hypothetical protein KFL_003430075 [Klebsormidium nitens]|eukprot:GAQ87288.1 hypothetical protein KFL_003430075 [Klebsormidium nitens]